MIVVEYFKGREVAVFGLAASGIATAKSLVAGGTDVIAWDDNPEMVSAARKQGLAVQDLRTIDWSDVAALVLAPGVPLTHPQPHWSVVLAEHANVEIIGDIELFARWFAAVSPPPTVVAVTGTNGKSTTCALIDHMLASSGRDTQLGGNIGRAVLTLDPPRTTSHFVVECSSYQIDLAPTFAPPIAVLLNLTPDHLDRHGTMERYARIKKKMVSNAQLAIVGVDDDYCSAIADRLEQEGRRVVRLSKNDPLKNGYYREGKTLMQARGGEVRSVASLEHIGSLRGSHNVQNALAAVAVCASLDMEPEAIQRGLNSFAGLAHRMEQVAHKGNVLFVNDSKATNAEAAAWALESFENIYWIAGGLPKAGGIDTLKRYFPRIAKAYLIGEAAAGFAATIGSSVPFEISQTLDLAVQHAARDSAVDTAEESVVLLSPACASFDQYRNFEKRGDAFRCVVQALVGIEIPGGRHEC